MAISHFLHPSHNLTELIADTSYICNGCRMHGTGTRFNCAPCDFDLHDYCARCPGCLPSTITHPHPMSLVVHKPQLNQTNTCKICHHAIQGLAYKCNDCIYWIHPLCVLHYLGPPYFLHPFHRLTELTTKTNYICNGCRMLGTGTRLSCIPCNFDLHDYCAKCPTSLPCIIHHAHPMILSVKKPGLNAIKLCHNCRNQVQGLGYECKNCNYWVHPLCSSQNLGLGHGGGSSILNQGHAYIQPGLVPPPMQTQTLPAPTSSFTQRLGMGMLINFIYDVITGDFSRDLDQNGDTDHRPINNNNQSDNGNSSTG